MADHRFRRGLTLGLVLTATALLGGCPAPCPTYPHQAADTALRYHRSMRLRAQAIRAEARVEQWGEQGRIRGTVLMFVQRPNRVRFDAMTQFQPAAILTSDGESFALTDLRENRYLAGPTCPENIARLLGIPMSGADVALFLLGDTPRIAASDETITCQDGGYLIVRHGEGQRQEIELSVRPQDIDAPPEEQRLRIRRSEVFDASGDRVWRVTFDDHRVVEDPESDATPRMGVAMPFQIHFQDARHDADTYVRFQSIDLNVEVPEEAFTQRPRPGLAVEWVECGLAPPPGDRAPTHEDAD